jgi:HPt (histidine-containing phosphotransfer) domain-containing protein
LGIYSIEWLRRASANQTKIMTETDDELAQTIAMLREDCASKLPAAIAEIEGLWRRLLEGEVPPAELQRVVGMVHEIAGAGAMFRLPAVSDAARALERFLEPIRAAGGLPDGVERERAEALLAVLKQTA